MGKHCMMHCLMQWEDTNFVSRCFKDTKNKKASLLFPCMHSAQFQQLGSHIHFKDVCVYRLLYKLHIMYVSIPYSKINSSIGQETQ